jgi:glycosyltransferase involved in cell wall biosynthesis
VTSSSSDDEIARLEAVVEGERANARHWRERAEREASAHRALRRRKSVRIALRLERELAPLLVRWRRLRARLPRARTPGATSSERADFVITTAAPSKKVAARWGDWHLAQDLARALERLGYRVRLHTADHAVGDAETRSCGVHVVMRGLTSIPRTPGPRHVLWVISHPEGVDERECDEADLVLVASERFAAELRTRTTTPVEVFLQATDHHRFFPKPPDPRYAHPVAVVAKTRDVMRPAVAAAIAAGLRPAIYGTGWEAFVDHDLIAGSYVPNEDLPRLYSSIGVLLNDHWDTMRAWGFVSNRLFDALACATPVISDHMPEIAAVFGSAVPTFTDSDDLRNLVKTDIADPNAARARAEAGRRGVLAAHTFDHRARDLVELLGRYDLEP